MTIYRNDLLKPIQQQLGALGLYDGAIDGIWGSGSNVGLKAALVQDRIVRLSPNFALQEFTVSSTADRLGILNIPTPQDLAHLIYTAGEFEKLRALLGRAIILTSGYRNERVNAAVGGVKHSDHTDGFAGDIRVAGYSSYQASVKIADLQKAGKIKTDQIIYERSRNITHVSFAPRKRGEILTQAGGPGSPVVAGIVA